MAYTIDTSGFTAMQMATVDKASDIALAYNAILRHEIGAEDFNRLRAADPANLTDNDLCDANMLLLAALVTVVGFHGEDEAMAEIVAPRPEIADLIFEIADDLRETRSFQHHG